MDAGLHRPQLEQAGVRMAERAARRRLTLRVPVRAGMERENRGRNREIRQNRSSKIAKSDPDGMNGL